MIVKSDSGGSTEVYFDKFAEVEPKVIKIRQLYRERKIDKDKVAELVGGLFGPYRQFNVDWPVAVGDAKSGEAIRKWDAWIEAQPLNHRLLYYNPHVVAACVMGEDE